jgi:hypothetical protein
VPMTVGAIADHGSGQGDWYRHAMRSRHTAVLHSS